MWKMKIRIKGIDDVVFILIFGFADNIPRLVKFNRIGLNVLWIIIFFPGTHQNPGFVIADVVLQVVVQFSVFFVSKRLFKMFQIIADAFQEIISVTTDQHRLAGDNVNSQLIHTGNEFTNDKLLVFLGFIKVNGPILIKFNWNDSLLLAISLPPLFDCRILLFIFPNKCQ